jgi:hypothetical protein
MLIGSGPDEREGTVRKMEDDSIGKKEKSSDDDVSFVLFPLCQA